MKAFCTDGTPKYVYKFKTGTLRFRVISLKVSQFHVCKSLSLNLTMRKNGMLYLGLFVICFTDATTLLFI